MVNISYYFLLKSNHSSLHLGNYNEKLRIIDFPVFVSGVNDNNLKQLDTDD